MHKYWGKKPASGISPLVDKYTEPGDLIIDPFAGYGVFCCEAFLKNRSVIVNDLNPIANFIAKNLFSKDVNISNVKRIWEAIKKEFSSYVMQWYQITINATSYIPISVLRSKEGLPMQFTFKDGKKTSTKDIPGDSNNTNLFVANWFNLHNLRVYLKKSSRKICTLQKISFILPSDCFGNPPTFWKRSVMLIL